MRLRLAFTAWVLAAAAACVTTPPPHPRAVECNELCANYIKQGDLTRAEVQCDLGLQFAPKYSDLWLNKGIIALRRGQKDQAREHFIRSLRYNQEQAQAYNNLGYIYLQEGAYGQAHDNFQRALKVDPDYITARFNLSLAFRGMKKPEDAKKQLRTIIAIAPKLADPHYHLGAILLDEKRLDEAIAELEQAVQLDSSYSEAWLQLGNAFAEAGRHCDAKDSYTACIEADAKSIECRNNLAIVVRKCALTDPVIKEAESTLVAAKTAPSMFALGKTYREKGLRNEEERAYRKCLRIDGKYAPCHYGLFEIYREDRRDKDSTIACKNFLKFALAEEFPKEVETCERYLSTSAEGE